MILYIHSSLRGTNISHQTGKGKSSTQTYLGWGYVSLLRGYFSREFWGKGNTHPSCPVGQLWWPSEVKICFGTMLPMQQPQLSRRSRWWRGEWKIKAKCNELSRWNDEFPWFSTGLLIFRCCSLLWAVSVWPRLELESQEKHEICQLNRDLLM